jgi:hypothetical protein
MWQWPPVRVQLQGPLQQKMLVLLMLARQTQERRLANPLALFQGLKQKLKLH